MFHLLVFLNSGIRGRKTVDKCWGEKRRTQKERFVCKKGEVAWPYLHMWNKFMKTRETETRHMWYDLYFFCHSYFQSDGGKTPEGTWCCESHARSASKGNKKCASRSKDGGTGCLPNYIKQRFKGDHSHSVLLPLCCEEWNSGGWKTPNESIAGTRDVFFSLPKHVVFSM